MNAVERESPLANPWLWVGSGVIVCLLGVLISFGGASATIGVAATVVIGLFLVGWGVSLRMNSTAHFLRESVRPTMLMLLSVFQLAGGLLVCWSLLAAFIGIDPLAPGRTDAETPPPLYAGLGMILWGLLAPMAANGAFQSWQRLTRRDEWTKSVDLAGLLMVAAVAAWLAGFALRDSADTLAFFLSVVTAFLAAAVSFCMVSPLYQKIEISAAILFHFTFIANATLAAPPSSWLMAQMWTRLSRPYLEFMYLNNAYHFYSPDPGPASYLWFRVYYDTGNVNPVTKQPILEGEWFKIPNVDKDGNHAYRVALEYQRHLSLTENASPSEVAPPFFFPEPDGKARPAPYFLARVANSPEKSALGEVVGKDRPTHVLDVPFHPMINPRELQYQKPTLATQRVLESYVRHVAKTAKHSLHPDEWKVHTLRVYRVIHAIPPWDEFARGVEPQCDPQYPGYYRPTYMGTFDPDGNLIDPDHDPLLYWVLPILPDEPWRKDSPLINYAAMHAGDLMYKYMPSSKKWVTEKGAEVAK